MNDRMATDRARGEIAHGRRLSLGDAEATWGWGTPAGRLRARRRADFILEGAALVPGMSALEIGCGTGMFSEMFAESGAVFLAVDIAEELVAQARRRGIPNVRFAARPFETCDAEGPFDAVLGSSVLHHLEIGPALTRILGLLKPGGRLSFAEPNYLNPQVFLERKLRFYQPLFWYVSPGETAFVRWSLEHLLERTGFCDISITPFDWLHPSTPERFVGPVRRIGRALEATPLLREFAGSLGIRARRPPS